MIKCKWCGVDIDDDNSDGEEDEEIYCSEHCKAWDMSGE